MKPLWTRHTFQMLLPNPLHAQQCLHRHCPHSPPRPLRKKQGQTPWDPNGWREMLVPGAAGWHPGLVKNNSEQQKGLSQHQIAAGFTLTSGAEPVCPFLLCSANPRDLGPLGRWHWAAERGWPGQGLEMAQQWQNECLAIERTGCAPPASQI